jgi:hypothetical protein
MLHARAIPAFAQALLIAEDFGDGANDAKRLVRQDEGIEADCEVRVGGEPAAHAQ